jgi:hypothetical protein
MRIAGFVAAALLLVICEAPRPDAAAGWVGSRTGIPPLCLRMTTWWYKGGLLGRQRHQLGSNLLLRQGSYCDEGEGEGHVQVRYLLEVGRRWERGCTSCWRCNAAV